MTRINGLWLGEGIVLNECGVGVACLTVLEKRQINLGLTRAFRRLWEWRLLNPGATEIVIARLGAINTYVDLAPILSFITLD